MRSVFSFRYMQQKSPHRSCDTLILFVAGEIFEDSEIDTCIQDEIESGLEPDQTIIIVPTTLYSAAITAFQQDKLTSLKDRLSALHTVTVISFCQAGKEKQRMTVAGPTPALKIAFADFSRRAQTEIFTLRNGFVEASKYFHFENPSQRHVQRFIKVSNIFASGPELKFFAFCTLPYIPESCTHIYVDTPALFGLVHAISLMRVQLGGKAISTDNFGSYGGIKSYDFTRTTNAVFLISASSSGSLLEKIKIHAEFVEDSSIIHFCYLGQELPTGPVVCNLSEDTSLNPLGFVPSTKSYSAGNCELCKSGSIAIKLQGDQFDIASPSPEAVQLVKSDALNELSPLLKRFAGKDIFGSGFGSPRTKQVRQYFIDHDAMFESDQFDQRLQYILSRSIPAVASAIIILDNESMPLAEKIQKHGKYPKSVKVLTRNDLRTLPRDENTKPVIIAASVIESGRGLQEISRDLRSTFPHAPQIYIVGFAKVRSTKSLEVLKNSLIFAEPQRHEFAVVEQLVLPPSSVDNMWQKEHALLLEYLDQLKFFTQDLAEAKHFFESRKNRLQQTAIPLRHDLYLTLRQPLKLQTGFVYWEKVEEHSQADVYFTISSVLQTLRQNSMTPGAKALHGSRNHCSILAAHNFGRFNDGIIQASLLRAALPHELNYSLNSKEGEEIARLIRRIVEDCELPRGEAALEFLTAIATQHLTLEKQQLDFILKEISTAPPAVKALIAICRHKLL